MNEGDSVVIVSSCEMRIRMEQTWSETKVLFR